VSRIAPPSPTSLITQTLRPLSLSPSLYLTLWSCLRLSLCQNQLP